MSHCWFARRVGALLFVAAVVVSAAAAGPSVGSAAAAPSNPLFFGCSRLITFDAGPEEWRANSTKNGQLYAEFGVAGWTAGDGNPGGAIQSDDLDGQWSELWTPPLAANGYDTDYRFAIGSDLQFDYRNNTGIGYDVYVAVQGADGARYYFVFRSQVIDSTQWNRIRVPMDPARWQTGFDNNTGPVGGAPTAEQFAAALADVDHFAFSIEGQLGPDTTLFDNFGVPCDDYADAPTSYGTSLTDQGPSHRLVDFDLGAHTAPLMLGTSIDADDDGMPGDAADGDDESDVDDEDGLTAAPTVTSGTAPIIEVGASNATDQPATLAGWLDGDGDGAFGADERTTVTVPAGARAASYSLAFGEVTTTEDTYVRFRLFPGELADPSPTGAAAAGEVEDYPVTVVVEDTSKDLTITKSVDRTQARAGEELTYTITATNSGPGDYTDEDPASWRDDLTDVLDDATLTDEITANTGALTFESPNLMWSGPLAAGETVTVTYTVTVTGEGDKVLHNIACATAEQCAETSTPVTDPTPPTPSPGPAPDPDDLARTGSTATTPLILGGLGALLLGAALVIVTRLRRRTRP